MSDSSKTGCLVGVLTYRLRSGGVVECQTTERLASKLMRDWFKAREILRTPKDYSEEEVGWARMALTQGTDAFNILASKDPEETETFCAAVVDMSEVVGMYFTPLPYTSQYTYYLTAYNLKQIIDAREEGEGWKQGEGE